MKREMSLHMVVAISHSRTHGQECCAAFGVTLNDSKKRIGANFLVVILLVTVQN